MKNMTRKGTYRQDGFEVRLQGFRISLGRAGVLLLAGGVAAIFYTIAARW